MTSNSMGWDAPVNPCIKDNQEAADCMLPMGEAYLASGNKVRRATDPELGCLAASEVYAA